MRKFILIVGLIRLNDGDRIVSVNLINPDSSPRCLVLGGRGFIGSHLVGELLLNGFRVRSFDRPGSQNQLNKHTVNPNYEICEGDFASETDIVAALSDCEYCFHLISTTLPKTSNLNPVFDVETNVVSTIRLLNECVKVKLRKIIFVSSGGTVYGNPEYVPIDEKHPTDPVCSYGISKLMIEKYLSLFNNIYNLDYSVIRLANPYGEGQKTQSNQGAVAVFLGKVLRGELIEIWGDGSVVRDYIHISDVVNALMLSMNPSTGKNVFNIGSGSGHSINEVLSIIEGVTNCKLKLSYLQSRYFDVPKNILAIDAARKYMGWIPLIGFREGVDRFAKWLIDNERL